MYIRASLPHMPSRIAPILVVCLLVFAGCTGSPGGTTTDTPTETPARTIATETTTPTESPAVSPGEARDRALRAEKARLRRTFDNSTEIKDLSIGIYGGGEHEITIENVSADAVYVRTRVSFSYEFYCDPGDYKTGAVDGQKTDSVYVVRKNTTELASGGIETPCGAVETG